MGQLLSYAIVALVAVLQAGPAVRESAAGPDHAPVVITVYSDFACEPCGHLAVVLQGVMQARPDEIRLVFRHVPREDGGSIDAHVAAIAAAQQNQFLELHNVLFANQDRLSRADVRAMAAQVRLDTAAFDQALARPELLDIVTRDRADAEARGVTQLPALFVNDVPLAGPLTLDRILQAIAH